MRRNELFFATRRHFNDPFDCRPLFRTKATNSQKQKFLQTVLRSGGYRAKTGLAKLARQLVDHPVYETALKESIQRLDERLDHHTGILCLSTHPDNILMWSHYADSHQGICLGFEGESGASPFPTAKPVEYRPRRPVCYPVVESNDEMRRLTLFTKLDQWAYEDEWRITSAEGTGAKKFGAQKLTEVILGAHISEEAEKMVRDWLRWRWYPVKLRRSVLRKDRFGIAIRSA